ncbi:MAG: hypothetical protein K6V73_06090 [Firmicutes bacterium]|nr:hypothetical protein [Bacillota bacterium]
MAIPVIAPAAVARLVARAVLLALAAWPGVARVVGVAPAFAGVLALVVGAVWVFAARAPLPAPAPLAPLPERVRFGPPAASVTRTIRLERMADLAPAALTPAAFALPAGEPVRLVILSDDPRPSPPTLPYTRVTGTAGGWETVDGRRVRSLPAGDIAHTLTVPAWGLNVPVPAARSGGAVRVAVTPSPRAAGTWQMCTPVACKGEAGAIRWSRPASCGGRSGSHERRRQRARPGPRRPGRRVLWQGRRIRAGRARSG